MSTEITLEQKSRINKFSLPDTGVPENFVRCT